MNRFIRCRGVTRRDQIWLEMKNASLFNQCSAPGLPSPVEKRAARIAAPMPV
jgi:hypothetical protein